MHQIIEDSTSLLLMCSKNHACEELKKTVLSLPFTVDVCHSREEAINLQNQFPRDIVLTEYELDNETGLDFLQAIYQHNKQSTRVVIGRDVNLQHIVKAVIKGVACAYIEENATQASIRTKLQDIARVRRSMTNKKLLEILPGSNEFPINMQVYELLMDAIHADRPIHEIAEIVTKDITLTAKVLQVANSAFYGNFSGTSVEKAIIYMGLNPVKDIVLMHSLSANLNMNSTQNKELEEIVKHSIETNYYFHAISRKADICPITPLNSSIGIIHDIGKLVQLVFFPMEYNAIDEYREENPGTDYYSCEIATGNLAIKHSEIGAYFLRCWNFNQYSVEAALYHHEPELATEDMRPCVESLFLANTIADIRDGFDISLEEALGRCKRVKLQPQDILTILPPL
jgi:HD-like signal output (HDOD) protein